EMEVRAARGHLTGVIEDRGVEEAVDHDPPLGLEQEAVQIAEAPTAEAPQVRTATNRRHHEERDLLIVLVERGLHPAAERDDPGLAQDRKMLDPLVVDLAEAEGIVPVGVVVERNAVIASASRIAWRSAPVEPNGSLGVEIGGRGAESRQRRGRVDGLDRWVGSLPGTLQPSGKLQASGQHQQPAGERKSTQVNT